MYLQKVLALMLGLCFNGSSATHTGDWQMSKLTRYSEYLERGNAEHMLSIALQEFEFAVLRQKPGCNWKFAVFVKTK